MAAVVAGFHQLEQLFAQSTGEMGRDVVLIDRGCVPDGGCYASQGHKECRPVWFGRPRKL